jgi:hypothetical protein
MNSTESFTRLYCTSQYLLPDKAGLASRSQSAAAGVVSDLVVSPGSTVIGPEPRADLPHPVHRPVHTLEPGNVAGGHTNRTNRIRHRIPDRGLCVLWPSHRIASRESRTC